MSQDLPLSREVDDHVVVHHLIRLLGRRPTPQEVAQFRAASTSPFAAPSATSSPSSQSEPGRWHRVPRPRPSGDTPL
jgi:hypothetical protein